MGVIIQFGDTYNIIIFSLHLLLFEQEEEQEQELRICDCLGKDRNRYLEPRINFPQKPKTVQYNQVDYWSQD